MFNTKTMKRLIGITIILLLTSNAFAHPYSGLLGYFHNKPAYNVFGTLEELRAVLDKPNTKVYLSNYTYSFFNNEKLYMLSYDTSGVYDQPYKIMRRVERGLFLFRLDANGWTKASDKPVQVDYEDCGALNEPYVSYFPWRIAGADPKDEDRLSPAKNGSVTVAENGVVTIVLVNHTNMKIGRIGQVSFFNSTVVLVPNADGTYNVQ
jgi:hypothetical protein